MSLEMHRNSIAELERDTRKIKSEALAQAVISFDVEPMNDNVIMCSVLATGILERAKMIKKGEI